MSLSEYSTNNNFYQALANRLDGAIEYPESLAINFREGRLLFEVVVNKKGVLQVIRSEKGLAQDLKTYCIVRLYETPSGAIIDFVAFYQIVRDWNKLHPN